MDDLLKGLPDQGEDLLGGLPDQENFSLVGAITKQINEGQGRSMFVPGTGIDITGNILGRALNVLDIPQDMLTGLFTRNEYGNVRASDYAGRVAEGLDPSEILPDVKMSSRDPRSASAFMGILNSSMLQSFVQDASIHPLNVPGVRIAKWIVSFAKKIKSVKNAKEAAERTYNAIKKLEDAPDIFKNLKQADLEAVFNSPEHLEQLKNIDKEKDLAEVAKIIERSKQKRESSSAPVIVRKEPQTNRPILTAEEAAAQTTEPDQIIFRPATRVTSPAETLVERIGGKTRGNVRETIKYGEKQEDEFLGIQKLKDEPSKSEPQSSKRIIDETQISGTKEAKSVDVVPEDLNSLVGKQIKSGSVTGEVIEDLGAKLRVKTEWGEIVVPKGNNVKEVSGVDYAKGLAKSLKDDIMDISSGITPTYRNLENYIRENGLKLSDNEIRFLKESAAKINKSKLLSESQKEQKLEKVILDIQKQKDVLNGLPDQSLLSAVPTKGPLEEIINLAKKELDPEKVGRGKLTKEMPERAFLAVDQDKVKAFRGDKLNLKEKARVARDMSDDTINTLYDDAVSRKSFTADDLFVIGEKVVRNTDEVVKSLKEGTVNDALANFISASTQKGRELRTIADVNDIIITALRRGTMGDTDLAELLVQAGMKKGDVTPSFMDKFVEWATMIKLTGISTHVKATLGNGSMLAFRPFEKLGAAAVSALTGKNRSVYAREALEEIYKSMAAVPSAWKKAKNVLASEELALKEASKFGEVVNRGGAIKGKFGEFVRLPGRVIGAVDIFFKELNYAAEVAAQATRLGIKRGLRGADLHGFIGKTVANPPDDIIKTAQKSSFERVFQEPLEGMAASVNVFRRNHAISRIIIPFWNTPVNLLKQSVQRTPLTAILPSTWKTLKGTDAAAKAELIGRAVSGSMFLTGAWWMGTQGMLTGGGPKSKFQKESLRATGWQPFSFKAGDTYISYRGFEPISSWLRVSSDIAEGKTKGEDILKSASISYLNQFIENPFLMGVQDLTGIGKELSNDNVPDIVTNLAIGSTVPTILQQWGTRVWDPVVRSPRGAWDKIKSRLPFGVSESVLPARDVFGEEVRRFNPVLQALGFTTSKDKDDLVANELARLKIGIGKPSSRIDERELSDEEYERLYALTGAMIKENLSRLMSAPAYSQISDEIKDKSIRKIINKSRNMAKKRELQKYYIGR